MTLVKVDDDGDVFYEVGMNDTEGEFEDYELYQADDKADATKFARDLAKKVEKAIKSGRLDKDKFSWKNDLNAFVKKHSDLD